jgi:regulator of sigma E protease
MITTISSIIIFSLVILIHELGHFLAARKVGIKVHEFSIGMGPVLYRKKGKQTDYLIKALPIGGYIRMEGEDDETFSHDSFNSKTALERFFVIFMGPMMNFILAFILFLVIVSTYGISGTTVEYIDVDSNEFASGLREGDEIISIEGNRVRFWDDLYEEISESETDYNILIERDGREYDFNVENSYRYVVGISPTEINGEYTTELSTVNMGYPAAEAGIKVGDRIQSINNIDTDTWEEVKDVIKGSQGNKIDILVVRNGKTINIDVEPMNQLTVGFYTEVEKNIVAVIYGSLFKTVFYIKLMFQFILMLFTGNVGTDAIAGPVGIISMVGEAAKIGIYPLINLAAFISINLGFMNLLPIPALDGSRLVFIIWEGVSGKRIPPDKEGYVHFIGFVFLMALMFFVLYKDILKLLT